MKKSLLLIIGLLASAALYGCSEVIEDSLDLTDKAVFEIATKQETGEGTIELLTPTISVKDNELEFMTEGIDEEKITFIYVANKKVFEQKIKNNEAYKLNIEGIEEAFQVDYKPKVQLMQTTDDTESGDIVTFKQVRYTVNKE